MGSFLGTYAYLRSRFFGFPTVVHFSLIVSTCTSKTVSICNMYRVKGSTNIPIPSLIIKQLLYRIYKSIRHFRYSREKHIEGEELFNKFSLTPNPQPQPPTLNPPLPLPPPPPPFPFYV